MSSITVVLSLQGLTALLLLTLYRRISRKQQESEQGLKKYLDTIYSQFESLLSLRSALGLAAPLPSTRGWAASPDFLLLLLLHARRQKPEVIVECSSGTSTVVLARAVQLNEVGHVFSLEHDPLYAEKTRIALEVHGLSAFATVIDAPLCPHSVGANSFDWYRTASLPGDIDMLVIDGPPSTPRSLARYPAVPLLIDAMSPNCVIFLDDADRPDEQATIKKWKAEYGFHQGGPLFTEKGTAVLARLD